MFAVDGRWLIKMEAITLFKQAQARPVHHSQPQTIPEH